MTLSHTDANLANVDVARRTLRSNVANQQERAEAIATLLASSDPKAREEGLFHLGMMSAHHVETIETETVRWACPMMALTLMMVAALSLFSFLFW